MSFAFRFALLNILLLMITSSTNAVRYAITKRYQGASFYQDWDFVLSDPSGGYVSYQTRESAWRHGYVRASKNGAYMGVDHNTTIAPRRSVRVESKQAFTYGLFIGDFSHMPADICGIWPAFWMYGVGATWPAFGEIDIIEGVNWQKTNHMTAHTTPGCSVAGTNSFAALNTHNCNEGSGYVGCSFVARNEGTYGSGFNRHGGGVYATQWTSNFISIWFFPRGHIPENIRNERPDPATWGRPTAFFWGGDRCRVNNHFRQMKLVLNIDFCGAWSKGLWGASGCTNRVGPTCESHVQYHPHAFDHAYWHINYVKVFHPTGPTATFNIEATNRTWVTAKNEVSDIPLPPVAMGNTVAPIIDTASPTSTAPSMAETQGAEMKAPAMRARSIPLRV